MGNKPALPLFSWKPEFVVIPFPANKRIGRARTAAKQIINRKTEKSRKKYWDNLIFTMENQMERVGIKNHVIEEEILAFAALVQKEVDRLNMYCGSQHNGGNDAA